jgi:hypothetical protein
MKISKSKCGILEQIVLKIPKDILIKAPLSDKNQIKTS